MRKLHTNPTLAAVGAGALALVMTGCASDYSADPQVLNRNMSTAQTLEAAGDSYEDTLVRQYRSLAVFEHEEMKDDRDANRWAEKAITASRAGDVDAEDPQKWGVGDAEVQDAFVRLNNVKRGGGMQHAPVSLAVAQTRFDCWVEQLDEGFQPEHINDCRSAYMRAMDRAERQVAEARAMETEQQAAVAPEPQQKEEVLLPFQLRFPFDVAQLQPDHQQTIEQIAEAIRQRDPDSVVIDGYADRAGPADYNFGLSERRAKNVREALEARGIENVRVRINTDWHGENNPIVETGDGVANPINRRVEVSVRGAEVGG